MALGESFPYPVGSMYGIFTTFTIGKYTIHGSCDYNSQLVFLSQRFSESSTSIEQGPFIIESILGGIQFDAKSYGNPAVLGDEHSSAMDDH